MCAVIKFSRMHCLPCAASYRSAAFGMCMWGFGLVLRFSGKVTRVTCPAPQPRSMVTHSALLWDPEKGMPWLPDIRLAGSFPSYPATAPPHPGDPAGSRSFFPRALLCYAPVRGTKACGSVHVGMSTAVSDVLRARVRGPLGMNPLAFLRVVCGSAPPVPPSNHPPSSRRPHTCAMLACNCQKQKPTARTVSIRRTPPVLRSFVPVWSGLPC